LALVALNYKGQEIWFLDAIVKLIGAEESFELPVLAENCGNGIFHFGAVLFHFDFLSLMRGTFSPFTNG
jgi:hypothetical protein